MSFILDALKKSEAERQRQSVPGLMDMGPAAVKPRFPVWVLILGLLLGINLIVLIVVLTRNPGGAPTQTAAVVAPAARSTATAPKFSPMDPVQPPVYAPEIPVADATAAPTPDPYASAVARAPQQVIAPSVSSPPLNPQLRVAPPPEEKGEVLPTLAEINLSGNHAIPELHLDIHVYAARPVERFVFINNQKYKEGATLAEGPTVERITRDGVVLSFQTLRFFLPRQ